MGPPETLVLAIRERLRIQNFVETGTYRGDTAAWASRHFPHVFTIELSPVFYAEAQTRFHVQPNVRVLNGDSSTMTREVLNGLAQPALFWLDAHWSGLDTAGREIECPVMAEIALINNSPLAHVVLIDDARLFCSPPPPPHRADLWPDLASMMAALSQEGRRYVVLTEDVFIAVPCSEQGWLMKILQDTAALTMQKHGRLAKWWEKIRP